LIVTTRRIHAERRHLRRPEILGDGDGAVGVAVEPPRQGHQPGARARGHVRGRLVVHLRDGAEPTGRERLREQRHDVALELVSDHDAEAAGERARRHGRSVPEQLSPTAGREWAHRDARLTERDDRRIGPAGEHLGHVPRDDFEVVAARGQPRSLHLDGALDATALQPRGDQQDRRCGHARHT
jgi:hypothetical protein